MTILLTNKMTSLNLTLLKRLLQCQSITPRDDGALTLLANYLTNLNFTVIEKTFGEGPEEVKNLYASLTKDPEGRTFCFAGHTDVVPPGNLEAWTYQPFSATIAEDRIFARGAQDMKGAIVAFISALETFLEQDLPFGTISLLLTGDEEKVAKYGTEPMLKFLTQEGIKIDSALVGEPVSKKRLADNIKIGARGSATFQVAIQGKQGHVAYEGATKNPVKDLSKLLSALYNHPFQIEEDSIFSKTNLEVTKIACDSGATNIVPDNLLMQFNFRYSDQDNYETLKLLVQNIAEKELEAYQIQSSSSGDAALWLKRESPFLQLAKEVIQNMTGSEPEVSTYGGTSDARFIRHYCETLEIGLVGDKAHQIDESVSIAELEGLTELYLELLKRYFK
jgi:succinyl-diaminopimelate desuccinylase